MSLYAITLLSNLNALSFALLLASIPVIMAPIIEFDLSNLQRKLLLILGVSMVILSSLWIVFAPNGALLREWAKESGYSNIAIPCITCR